MSGNLLGRQEEKLFPGIVLRFQKGQKRKPDTHAAIEETAWLLNPFPACLGKLHSFVHPECTTSKIIPVLSDLIQGLVKHGYARRAMAQKPIGYLGVSLSFLP